MINRITLPKKISPAVVICCSVGNGASGSGGVSMDDIAAF